MLLGIYLGMAIYFMNHFYFGSSINCISISGKTVEEVHKQMLSQAQAYTLNIKERGGKNEKITAIDICLKYNLDGKVKNLIDKQNSFNWIYELFNKKDYKITYGLSYDKDLLKKSLDKRFYFNSSNIIEPKNPSFKYTDNGYEIVDEVKGNKVNKDILYSSVENAILKYETKVDLELMNCYVNSEYTSKSKKIVDIKNQLNKYVYSKIIYTFEPYKEILDGSMINKWLKVDENLVVIFDEKKVKDYVNLLSKAYDTIGTTRNFDTSLGKIIEITGGDYGWFINTSKETQDLINAIKGGQIITKEPAYIQTALSHNSNDIGNTYVEVNMTKQHLWFYKNGSLVVQGDVVTGNVNRNHSTPIGIYKVKYKQKDTSLIGPDYNVPVSFWMPFNEGIGIHDASWRNVFGGNIYMTNGSHGCINAPYYLAQAIFNNIQAGTPVICYY